MARTGPEGEETEVPGLALRLVLAALAITGYLFVRGELDAAALVAAKFGLGITLFTVLIDLGRALAGAEPPVPAELTSHEQRAEPLVDDTYRRVHQAMRDFLDEGEWTPTYDRLVHDALEERGVPSQERDPVLAHARATAKGAPTTHRPMPLAILSGLVATAGVAVAVGVLLEALGQPLFGPVLLLVGLGTYLLQTRTLRAGERWATLVVGLAGALLVYLGALSLSGSTGGAWGLVQLMAAGLAAATIGLVVFHAFPTPPWREVQASLREELGTLRRAFLAALLAGLVLFPFKPLLDGLFEALGWPIAVPYRMAVIGYATVAAFLAMELGGAWYALDRGQTLERTMRRERIEANEALLSLMESGSTKLPGGRAT